MARYTLTVTGPHGDTLEEKLPSVTEIIDKVLAKRGLPDWYYKNAVSGFSALLTKYGDALPQDVPSLHSLMKSEGLSPYAVRDSAAADGTRIHKAVETLAKGRRPKSDYEPLNEWWQLKGLRKANVLGAEQIVYSPRNWYAGTVDLVYLDPNPVTELATEGAEVNVNDVSIVLADVKTGQPRESHAVQLEMYRWAWEEMGRPKINRMQIIQIPRDGSSVLEHEVEMTEQLTEATAGILSVWRWSK